jgi:hypothetical protein
MFLFLFGSPNGLNVIAEFRSWAFSMACLELIAFTARTVVRSKFAENQELHILFKVAQQIRRCG